MEALSQIHFKIERRNACLKIPSKNFVQYNGNLPGIIIMVLDFSKNPEKGLRKATHQGRIDLMPPCVCTHPLFSQ